MLRRWRHVHVMSRGHDVTQSWSNLIESYLWCESRRILSFIPKRNILVDLWLNYSEKEHSNLFCNGTFFSSIPFHFKYSRKTYSEKEHIFIFCVSIPQKTIPVFQKGRIQKSYSEKVIFLYSVRVFQKEPSPYSKKAYAICFYSEKAKILYSGQIFRKSQISIPKKTFFRRFPG